MSRLNARKISKTLLWATLAMTLLAVVAVLTSPWWLEAALRPILAREGITFGQYERSGYGEFILRDVRYEDEDVAATVTEVKAPGIPTALMNLWTNRSCSVKAGTVELVRINQGEPSSGESKPEPESGPVARGAQILEYLNLSDRVNLEAFVERVHLEESSTSLTATDIIYDGQSFHAVLTSSITEQTATVDIHRWGTNKLRVIAEISPEPIVLTVDIDLTDPSELKIYAPLTWRGQSAILNATWQGEDWLPNSATLTAKDWTLPEDFLSKEDRQGYAAPKGSLEAEWNGERYQLSLDAAAAPDDSDLPVLNARVEASGDLEAVTVEQARIEGGWIEGQLYEPVTVPFTSLKDLPPFGFALAANFDQQSLLPLKGQTEMRMEADDRPDDAYPLVTALFSGKNLRYGDYTVDLIQAEATLDWPLLTVERFMAELPEQSKIEATATVDLAEENIDDLQATATVSGKLAAGYGISDPVFESLIATFTVNGPRARPRHEGSLRIEQLAWADDLINVDLAWKGVHGELEVLSGKGDGETLDLTWEGGASLGLESQRLTLKEALLQPSDAPEIRLVKPVNFTRKSDGEITIDDLSLEGEQGGFLKARGVVQWPERGELTVSGQANSPVWIKVLTDAELPFPTQLQQLDLSAQWDNGPMRFTLDCKAVGFPEGQEPFQVEALARSKGESVELSQLEVRQGENLLTTAQGNFPVVVNTQANGYVTLDPKAPANFTLQAQPGATPLWRWLQNRYHVILERPEISLKLAGSLSEPSGQLRAGLARLDFPEGSGLPHIPRVDNLSAQATFSPEEIRLDGLRTAISGQTLELSGRQPMSKQAWTDMLSGGTPPDFEKASAKLTFEEVPLKAFETFLPEFFRSKGTFSLHAELKPGLDWFGELDVRDVETMPLPKLGSLAGISARMKLAGHTLTVDNASALVGGRELTITGDVDIADPYAPVFDLALTGDNVPFVRAPGLIIRGSPDLTLKTNDEQITTLAGKVQLNESFYTVDLASLGQSNDSDPNRRFPYFSVEEEPLASWRLNIDVEGTEFLRVRTPVFEGLVSADMELRGTLYEPLATGQAAIDKGVVLFPFANFRVEQGSVTIRQDQPFTPEIDVTATGRAYGYDLIMRLTGTPDEPLLTFSSTPALEQGDILLMVTAGRMPENDQRSSQSRLAGLGIFIGNTILVDMGLVDPLDDRLQVYIGEDVTETGKDTVKVIYRINDTWALVGQYDRFDAFTLDLHWTIYEE